MMESGFFDLESAKAHAQARARWVAQERAAARAARATRHSFSAEKIDHAALEVSCRVGLLVTNGIAGGEQRVTVSVEARQHPLTQPIEVSVDVQNEGR